MINANELRLNNIVSYKGKVGIVKGFYENDNILSSVTVYFDQRKPVGIDDLEPIPLTPEWLERCGFTWDEENQVYSIQIGNALYLEYDKDFDCAINPESWPGESTYVWGEIKTVHQLQNLYFALTGVELQIKNT